MTCTVPFVPGAFNVCLCLTLLGLCLLNVVLNCAQHFFIFIYSWYMGGDQRCTSPLLMAGHRQVISRNSKGSQHILIYNFIITTFDCQGTGISAGHFLWKVLVWHRHWRRLSISRTLIHFQFPFVSLPFACVSLITYFVIVGSIN